MIASLPRPAWLRWGTLAYVLAQLVIPGVVLGISILAFASRLAQFADDQFGWELELLRPGPALVVLGQFSYIISIATLMISARLKRFDRTLEEAAYNLGATRSAVLSTLILPYLRPALLALTLMRRPRGHAPVE